MAEVRERWLCCKSMRRTQFCPDCGGERPEVVASSEAEQLADEFKAEAEKCFRTADTYKRDAERIRATCKLSDLENPNVRYSQTWGDVAHHRQRSAEGFRKRGNKIARYERIIRELIAKATQ